MSQIDSGKRRPHSDRIATLATHAGDDPFRFLGAAIGPFEAWLIARGLRTLPARMRQHQESAAQVAKISTQSSASPTPFGTSASGS